MNFQIGDKVVCVDDGPWPSYAGIRVMPDRLKRGTTYVIREILNAATWRSANNCKIGIRLSGFNNGWWSTGVEGAWNATRFRKLDDLKAQSRERHHATQTTPQP